MKVLRGSMRCAAGAVICALAVVACGSDKTVEAPKPAVPEPKVKIAWDAPTGVVKGYRILIDERVVAEIPPPPLDPSCSCPTTSVAVPRGEHTIKVIAYNDLGESPPTTVTVTK